MRTSAALPLVRTFLGPVSAALLLASGNAAMVVFDDFSGTAMNPSLWTLELIGSGPTVQQSGGTLNIALPGNSTSAPRSGFAGGYLSDYLVGGDMDIQVSYSLLLWSNLTVASWWAATL